jgi:hypothetical protein
VPIGKAVLCKHAGVKWSEVFEIKKKRYSENDRAVLLTISLNLAVNHTFDQWHDVDDLDEKWEVFDAL